MWEVKRGALGVGHEKSGQWHEKPNCSGVNHWQIVTWDELPRNHAAKTNPFFGMVQKRVTAQEWLGSTPEGQRPQIRGLRAGGSLAVASSIPATQLSSPARLAERVVTPHAPMTLGANHVSRARTGVTLPLLVISGWATGPPQGWATGFDSSPRADNTLVRAGGVLSVGTPRCSDLARQFTEHLFRYLSVRIPRISTNLNILRAICSGYGDAARRAAATAAPDGSPRSYPRPTPTAASGQ